jgi:hypothetical protein
MQEILVDRRELLLERLIEIRNDLGIALHDFSMRSARSPETGGFIAVNTARLSN